MTLITCIDTSLHISVAVVVNMNMRISFLKVAMRVYFSRAKIGQQ